MSIWIDSFGNEKTEEEYNVFGTAWPSVDVTLTSKGWAVENEFLVYGEKA
jgi:hypothetical protein